MSKNKLSKEIIQCNRKKSQSVIQTNQISIQQTNKYIKQTNK